VLNVCRTNYTHRQFVSTYLVHELRFGSVVSWIVVLIRSAMVTGNVAQSHPPVRSSNYPGEPLYVLD